MVSSSRIQCAAGSKQRIYYRCGSFLQLHRQRNAHPIPESYSENARPQLPGHCGRCGLRKRGQLSVSSSRGQNCYIKPTNYQTRKTRKYCEQLWRAENMRYLEDEDCFVCAAGRKLRFYRSCSQESNGVVTTYNYYQCDQCTGCPVRKQCTKSQNPDFAKK